MPLAPKKIEEFRKNIASFATVTSKVNEISKYEAKIVLPVVTAVLQEIEVKLKQNPQAPGVPKTLEFVNYAINILKETDERQQITLSNLWNLRKIFADITKERIESELGKMVTYANQLELTPNTIALWEEVGLGLEGLYKRTYDKIPKERNGQLKTNKHGLVDPVDREDKLFHSIFHLTKFSIVSYYHAVNEAIIKKINAYQPQLQDGGAKESKAPVAVSPDVSSKSEIIDKEEAQPILADEALHIYSRKKEGHHFLVLDFPQGSEDKMAKLVEEYKKLFGIERDLPIEDEPAQEPPVIDNGIKEFSEETKPTQCLPYEFLELYANDVDDIKLSVFICALDLYKLNDRQALFLKNFKPNIIAGLDAYINSKFTTWGLPTIIWAPAHITIVQKKRDQISSNDDIANNLKDLYDLLIEVRGENSYKVRKRVSLLLQEAFTIAFRNATATNEYKSQLKFA